jgi:hypothetical protein
VKLGSTDVGNSCLAFDGPPASKRTYQLQGITPAGALTMRSVEMVAWALSAGLIILAEPGKSRRPRSPNRQFVRDQVGV